MQQNQLLHCGDRLHGYRFFVRGDVIRCLFLLVDRIPSSSHPMIEVHANDRLGKKVKVKCNEDDTIGDLKKVLGLQLAMDWEKIVLKKGYQVYKDHIMLSDYEIHDGFNFELYYG